MVNIIFAYVVDLGKGRMERLEGWEVRGEGGAFGGEEGGDGGNAAQEGDAAAILI